MICLSFILLSRGSFATPLSLILSLIISPSCMPLMLVLFDRARPSFDQSSHGSRQWLLLPVLLHPPPHLPLPRVVWLSRPSWLSLSAWMLTLTLSMMSCVKWTLVWAVSLDDRLLWVVSPFLHLHLQGLQRMRAMMMAPVMMMMMMMMRMRMRVLAFPVMRRWLLHNDLPFIIRDKMGK